MFLSGANCLPSLLFLDTKAFKSYLIILIQNHTSQLHSHLLHGLKEKKLKGKESYLSSAGHSTNLVLPTCPVLRSEIKMGMINEGSVPMFSSLFKSTSFSSSLHYQSPTSNNTSSYCSHYI